MGEDNAIIIHHVRSEFAKYIYTQHTHIYIYINRRNIAIEIVLIITCLASGEEVCIRLKSALNMYNEYGNLTKLFAFTVWR